MRVGELLEQAIAAAGFSVRGYARRRAERQWGPRVTSSQVESKRRQLSKWIAGDTKSISDAIAEQLAADLGKPADYFKTEKPRRRARSDELMRLQAQVADLEAHRDRQGRLLAELQREVEELRRVARPAQRKRA